ncbi:Ig-like domain repeat protein [Leucobacter weissii]|uniref:Ig-like domain repeat protein n=1 Tax=Leucobacter weissii TaxID=1983706 RepID=A0A939SBC1_9MICO|nr:Ig-like domain-containing protein [Leucobacter weissii]MBO1902847.1 Ig-like domain repeat protein [Leucobacter weissii]
MPRLFKGALALGVSGALVLSAAPAAMSADHHDGHAHVADAYTLELLSPTNDGVTASALGINETGDVVGITRPTSSAQPQRTVLWERHGDHFHAHELANLEGSNFSRGFDINSDRVIVGEAFNSGGSSIPIRWGRDRLPLHESGLSENGRGILNDVNDAGDAVGTADSKALVLRSGGAVSELAAPALDAGVTVKRSAAARISETGVVGGTATLVVPHGDHTHDESHVVVWSASGEGRVLAQLEGSSTPSIADVEDDGSAVGKAKMGSADIAVSWDAEGQPTQLPLEASTEFPHGVASAATSDGLIVGGVTKFAGNSSFGGAAVAWDAHGPVDLNTRVGDKPAEVNLLAANDVNEQGQIVGSATVNGAARGFVLTPVPEPSLTLAPISHHYHSGSPIAFSLTADPAPAAGDAIVWEWKWPGTEHWSVIPGASGLTHTLTAEQALHGVEVRATLNPASGGAPRIAEPARIDIDDHGHGPVRKVTIAGLAAHYHSDDPIELTATVEPASIVDRWEWLVQRVGQDEAQPVAGQNGSALALSADPALDGAEVFARLLLPNGTEYARSEPVTVSVDDHHAHAAATTTRVALKPGKLRYGSGTVATVTVRSEQGSPSGRVTVRAGGKNYTGTLRNGTARIPLTRALQPGKRIVTAAYGGNERFEASTAKAGLRVLKAKPKVSVKLSKPRIKTSQRARATVSVRIPGAAKARPSGTVVVLDGKKRIASKRLSVAANGKVSVRLPELKSGTRKIRVRILSTPRQESATSGARTLRVVR